jgi:hypothetical protein
MRFAAIAMPYALNELCRQFDWVQRSLISSTSGWSCRTTSTLSTSIAFYRPQATFFDGRLDGKIGTPRHEVACFKCLHVLETFEWE